MCAIRKILKNSTVGLTSTVCPTLPFAGTPCSSAVTPHSSAAHVLGHTRTQQLPCCHRQAPLCHCRCVLALAHSNSVFHTTVRCVFSTSPSIHSCCRFRCHCCMCPVGAAGKPASTPSHLFSLSLCAVLCYAVLCWCRQVPQAHRGGLCIVQ
jgi:hypothetical protein